jgi:oxepin-CoA hydrolase/3-oxo-5,6-dehydrosuberyl-CoA semialdehyde dehydrogenase
MIAIDNIDETIGRLSKLNDDTQPVFGSMRPQQMVEHLTMTIKASNGKIQATQRTSEEDGAKFKAEMIYTDMEFPMGIKTPTIPDGPPVYVYTDLPAAIAALKTELQDFENYYKNSPDASPTHARLGVLDHNEWLIFHSKHFTHHFKQFGLI